MDKLLDVLKAGTWKALGLAIASGLAIVGLRLGLIPDPGKPIVFGAYALFLLGSALTVVGALQALAGYLKPGVWIVHWRDKGDRRREAEDYIEFMTEEDRKIIGHLLHLNRKTFSGAMDGGYARELIARGIVNQATRPGYHYDPENIPFVVNEQAWKVLSKRKDEFPLIEDDGGGDPWRVPWMLR
ncbi:hypothetical protein [Brevundimonas sp.]|uniref:hypothetical protein n=1 Tax=Brevundimonas sp. TaxID=1871086 RepID=UPI00289BE033|nr:hypothetical protein [Brevundimonas sp.]